MMQVVMGALYKSLEEAGHWQVGKLTVLLIADKSVTGAGKGVRR